MFDPLPGSDAGDRTLVPSSASGSAITLGDVQHDGLDTRPGLNGHFTMDVTGAQSGTSVVTIEHKSSKTGTVVKTLTYTFDVA